MKTTYRLLITTLLVLICTLPAIAQENILERAVQNGTATREQQLELARIWVSNGRFYEASKLAQRLIDVDPADAEATAVRDEATRGLRALNEQKLAAAEAAARREGATDSDQLALADAYFQAGQYRAAADLYGKLPESVMTRDSRLRQARALTWSGQHDRSERVYAQLLREQRTPELELEYGRMLSWMGTTRAATETLTSVYQRERNEQSALALANAKAWSGDREGAIRLLAQFTSDNPSAMEAQRRLEELRTSPEIRLERLEKLTELDPYNLAIRVERARVLTEAGRHAEALKTIRFVREHSPTAIEGLDDLDKEISRHRDIELASAAERRKALDVRNPATADEILALAKSYTGLAAYDDAARLYRDYLALRPDDVEARLNYARVLSWNREYRAAQREYEKILQQQPDRADVRLEYAQVLSWDQEYPEAVQMFSSLTDLSDNPRAHLYREVPPQAHHHLGQIYRWFGWNDHAVEQQTIAMSLDGGYLPAMEELELARRGRPASTLNGRYSYSSDSNDFTFKRVDLEGELWRTQRTAFSLGVGRHNFEQRGTEVDANAVWAGLTQRTSDNWTLRARAGATIYEQDLGTRPFFGAGAEFRPNLESRAAFDYNHYDLVYDVLTLRSLTLEPGVGRPPAPLDEPIDINDFRAHYDWNGGGVLSLLGDATYGFISDDNNRAGAHGIVSFRLFKTPFVAIKADGRYLSYDFRTNRYWSPDDYRSLAGVLQVGQNIRNRVYWTVEGKLGKSWENDRHSDLRAIAGALTIPLGDAIDLIGHYGYGKSGRFDSILGNDPSEFRNYWQRNWYVGIRLKRLYASDDRVENRYYYDDRVLTGSPVIPLVETR